MQQCVRAGDHISKCYYKYIHSNDSLELTIGNGEFGQEASGGLRPLRQIYGASLAFLGEKVLSSVKMRSGVDTAFKCAAL